MVFHFKIIFLGLVYSNLHVTKVIKIVLFQMFYLWIKIYDRLYLLEEIRCWMKISNVRRHFSAQNSSQYLESVFCIGYVYFCIFISNIGRICLITRANNQSPTPPSSGSIDDFPCKLSKRFGYLHYISKHFKDLNQTMIGIWCTNSVHCMFM